MRTRTLLLFWRVPVYAVLGSKEARFASALLRRRVRCQGHMLVPDYLMGLVQTGLVVIPNSVVIKFLCILGGHCLKVVE